MFDFIKNKVKKSLGIVGVEETDKGVIIISGIDTNDLTNNIQKVWNTSKIGNNLFFDVGNGVVKLHSFFAIELKYILEKLLAESEVPVRGTRQMTRILSLLKENTYLAKLETDPQHPPEKILNFNLIKQFKWTPLPHQQDFLNYYDQIVPRYSLNGALLSAAPGAGKAQPLNAKIKVPGGWKRMGDMQIGDLVSTPDNGVAMVTGVFPQGMRPVYQLTMQDGRVVHADINHLWEVYLRQKINGKTVKIKHILTTKDLIEYMAGGKDRRAYLPMIKPITGFYKPMPVDPYLLGVLLGDGCIAGGSVRLSTPDQFIVDEVNKLLPTGVSIKKDLGENVDYRLTSLNGQQNNLVNSLRELNVYGLLSYNKSFPNEYLEASYEQRLALLQGLMDTDGTVDDHSSCSYCTTSFTLARQVQDLVRSMGWHAKVSVKEDPTYTYKGEKRTGRTAYNVCIRSNKPSLLFRLPRKKERCNDNGQYCNDLMLAIKTIDFIGEDLTQCIMIDHPEHLYITDHYTVTHNTATAIMAMLGLDLDIVFIISPKKAIYNVWEKTISEAFKVPQVSWVAERGNTPAPNCKWFIFHYERLEEAYAMAKKMNLKNRKFGIILDESHNFNEIKSNRTELFTKLCSDNQCKNIIEMSGTPLKALGYETIPMMRVLDRRFTPGAEEAYKKIFGRGQNKANDILANRLGLISFSVPKSTFMTDKPIEIPKKIKTPNSDKYTLSAIKTVMMKFIEERTIYYKDHFKEYELAYNEGLAVFEGKMSPTDQRDYETYKKNVGIFRKYGYDARTMVDLSVFCNKFEKEKIMPALNNEMRKTFASAKSVVKYVDLKIKGECLGRILSRERIQCHIDMVEYMGLPDIIESAKKKTLIFTSFVQVLEKIRDVLQKEGYNPVTVYGQTNSNLKGIVDEFSTNDNIDSCIATFMSLSEAVPVTAANVIVMTNAPFRHHEYEQAVARAHRLGQDTQVYVYNLTLDTGSEPNISTRSEDIMEWSKGQIDQLMGLDRYGSTIEIEDVGMEDGEDSVKSSISAREQLENDIMEEPTMDLAGRSEALRSAVRRW